MHSVIIAEQLSYHNEVQGWTVFCVRCGLTVLTLPPIKNRIGSIYSPKFGDHHFLSGIHKHFMNKECVVDFGHRPSSMLKVHYPERVLLMGSISGLERLFTECEICGASMLSIETVGFGFRSEPTPLDYKTCSQMRMRNALQ